MPEIIVHNIETGEIELREMTKNEMENAKKVNDDANLKKETQKQLRAALLERLGISEEEVSVLLG